MLHHAEKHRLCKPKAEEAPCVGHRIKYTHFCQGSICQLCHLVHSRPQRWRCLQDRWPVASRRASLSKQGEILIKCYWKVPRGNELEHSSLDGGWNNEGSVFQWILGWLVRKLCHSKGSTSSHTAEKGRVYRALGARNGWVSQLQQPRLQDLL